MQDRLKTRLWDAEEKIMHYTDFVITSTGYVAKLQPMYELEEDENGDEVEIQSKKEFFIDQTDFEFDKKMIVMQSTGLKDKNGKLIYEGDVVKIANGSINGEVAEGLHVVKWFVNKWQGCPSWLVNSTDTSHYIEVIGNIYENSELYKGE